MSVLPNYDDQASAQVEKHPHSRGEDSVILIRKDQDKETPPLTWGRRQSLQKALPAEGNTPTHVGKTFSREDMRSAREKHPHSRGEDS